ncbi:hypothetical protein ACH5AG_26260 [Streptomyces anulatus]
MSEHAGRLEIQLSVWDHRGVYNDVAVGRDVTAALAAVRDVPLTGTRAAYAARLRAVSTAVAR